MTTTLHDPQTSTPPATATLGGETQSRKEQVALALFILVPFAALVAAVPVAWGGWLGWTDVAIAVPMYFLTCGGVTVGFHRGFTHRSFKPNRPVKIALAVARLDGDPGAGRAVGGRPPQAPQVLGQGRRPALPLEVRRHGRRALEGAVARPHGLALRRGADPAAQVRPRPDEGPRHRRGLEAVLAVDPRLVAPAALDRWPGHHVLAGRADRVLLGQPGPGQPAAPRHLVDQLDLPHGRRAAVPLPRHVRQRLVAGGPVDGRVLAQPAPRRAHLGPARRAPRAGRLLGPRHLAPREGRLGAATCAGPTPSASSASARPDAWRVPLDRPRPPAPG